MTTLSPLSGSPASNAEAVLATPIEVPSNVQPTNQTSKPAAKKPRKRVNTAEKRHQHNAIERQRRETLNGKFIVLARLLPALANHRRPSKSAIVNGSIAHLTYQRDQRLLASKLLRSLAAEHDSLLNEVNEWRKASGYAPKESACAWTEGIEEVCSVEKEVFGTFQNVDGEDGEDEDQEDVPQYTAPVSHVFTQSTGLITPRPSTDVASAQALLSNMLMPETRCSTATASSVGLDWSSEFAWSVNNGSRPMESPVNVHSQTNAFPFSFMGRDSVDTSTTDSPATSQNAAVLTPPTYDMLNHTPSPHSSNGHSVIEEPKQSASAWNPAQVLYAQQQIQLQQRQAQNTGFTPSFPFTSAVQPVQSTADSAMFTQQLMASMFPSQTQTATLQLQAQLEQWRKNAMVGRRPTVHQQTSVHDLREAVRLGMGAGVGGMTWSESQNQAVEGF